MDVDKWITHILALLFSIVLLGLAVYTIVIVEDPEIAKAAMGFSAGILGIILGFYFNRERLVAEIRERERVAQQRDELNQLRIELMAELGQRIQEIEQRVLQEPEDTDNL